MIISFILVVISPWIVSYVSNGSPHWRTHYLQCWFRVLQSIALMATLLLSVQGFVAIYFSPLNLLEYYGQIGSGVFVASLFSAIGSVILCGTGVVLAWRGSTGGHLVCVVLAEALFLVFDSILIRALRPVKDTRAVITVQVLEAWVRYIDRPATLAFLLLFFGIFYLQWHGIFQDDLEIEGFAAGAVFFALMAANLAFVAANTAADRALQRSVGLNKPIHGQAGP